MFTGLVEETGTVRAIEPNGRGMRLHVDAVAVVRDAVLGASIAVNGCCLTAVELRADGFAADAVPETLDRTNLGRLAVGDRVNLERPLTLGALVGGHLVTGHIDATTTVRSVEHLDDGSARIAFDLPDAIAPYVVEKGSVALDGTSLTVAALHHDSFEIAVIPHTLAVTVLGTYRPGTVVNVEADLLAKHVERLLEARLGASNATGGAR